MFLQVTRHAVLPWFALSSLHWALWRLKIKFRTQICFTKEHLDIQNITTWKTVIGVMWKFKDMHFTKSLVWIIWMIWNTGKPDRYKEIYYKRSKPFNHNKENCPPTTKQLQQWQTSSVQWYIKLTGSIHTRNISNQEHQKKVAGVVQSLLPE